MKTQCTVALSMLAGFGMGAVAITGLNAQGKPGAYAVIDISEITDPEAFKQVGPKAGASAAAAGAHFVARTENIIALHGDAPKRFVIIAFDSIEKAKAFDATPAQKLMQFPINQQNHAGSLLRECEAVLLSPAFQCRKALCFET